MKKATMKLLIIWITGIVGMIMYQGNIFPQSQCEELYINTSLLIKALEKE